MEWIIFDICDKSTYPKSNVPIIAAYQEFSGEKVVTLGYVDKFNNTIQLERQGTTITYILNGLVAWCDFPAFPDNVNLG